MGHLRNQYLRYENLNFIDRGSMQHEDFLFFNIYINYIFRENNISTYFIIPPPNRRKPHLFNTLNVRNNMLTGGKIIIFYMVPCWHYLILKEDLQYEYFYRKFLFWCQQPLSNYIWIKSMWNFCQLGGSTWFNLAGS